MVDFIFGKAGMNKKIPYNYSPVDGAAGTVFRDSIYEVLVDNSIVDQRIPCTVTIPLRNQTILDKFNLSGPMPFEIRTLAGNRVGKGKYYQRVDPIDAKASSYVAKDFFVRMDKRSIESVGRSCGNHP